MRREDVLSALDTVEDRDGWFLSSANARESVRGGRTERRRVRVERFRVLSVDGRVERRRLSLVGRVESRRALSDGMPRRALSAGGSAERRRALSVLGIADWRRLLSDVEGGRRRVLSEAEGRAERRRVLSDADGRADMRRLLSDAAGRAESRLELALEGRAD